MKLISQSGIDFTPAGHEDPINPGVWKKILSLYPEAPSGRVQMVNWAKIEPGKVSSLHHHTSMHEIFIICGGPIQFIGKEQRVEANRGDMVIIDAGESHSLRNPGKETAFFFAIGLVVAEGGKTVVEVLHP